MKSVEPAAVLNQCALPRDGHREKEGVEPRVIEGKEGLGTETIALPYGCRYRNI
jgi:hypothetical protein